ncbi:MAG TPA: energy transducer TonB [bacterium]|jgi:TonB family protein|nr:energy transducer TonB [bacterium]
MKLDFRGAVILSIAAHAVCYGGGYGWMAWQRSHFDAMDIDLSRSSLMPLPPHMGTYVPKPPEEWYVGDVRRLAPRPLPPPLKAVAKPAEEEGEVAPPCPPPCPSEWASSAQSVQKPQWTDGMITEDDYPQEARYKNITGLVVVQVSIDTQGVVRDVKLLQGSDPLLNDKTLEKLRQARFSPCIDAAGQPFPCTLRLPINWTLE